MVFEYSWDVHPDIATRERLMALLRARRPPARATRDAACGAARGVVSVHLALARLGEAAAIYQRGRAPPPVDWRAEAERAAARTAKRRRETQRRLIVLSARPLPPPSPILARLPSHGAISDYAASRDQYLSTATISFLALERTLGRNHPKNTLSSVNDLRVLLKANEKE